MTTPTPKTVLVVDDEPAIRLIVRASLASAGYVVKEAGTTELAADAMNAATQPFDLIVLDLTMPGGSGEAFIPIVHAQSPTSKVLVFSGAFNGDALDIGADGFLAKPFTRAELLEAAEKALAAA